MTTTQVEEVVQHIEHYEDMMWLSQQQEVFEVLDALIRIDHERKGQIRATSVASRYDIRVKMDGALAITLGKELQTGKFAISTKHKRMPLFFSIEEIEVYEMPVRVKSMLKAAFNTYKDFNWTGWYQADFLSEPTDNPIIQPNVVEYTLVNPALAEAAKTGAVIVPHTLIHGEPLQTFHPAMIDNRLTNLDFSKLAAPHAPELQEHVDAIRVLNWSWIDEMKRLPKFSEYATRALNRCYRNSADNDLRAETVQALIMQFYKDDVDSKSSEAGKAKAQENYDMVEGWLTKHPFFFATAVQNYRSMQYVRDYILQSVECWTDHNFPVASRISLTVQTDTGFTAILSTSWLGEGLVIKSPINNSYVKLVNRDVFSRANFLKYAK